LVLVMLGLILGLAWAYLGAPVKFRDAEPVHLADGYKDQWIKMTAVEFAASGDVDEATRKIVAGGVTPKMIENLISENQGTPLAGQLQTLLPVATGAESQAKDQAKEIETGFISNWVMGPLGCIIGTLLIGILLSLVLTFYFAIPVGKWAKPRARPSMPGVPATAVSAGSAHAAAVAEKRHGRSEDRFCGGGRSGACHPTYVNLYSGRRPVRRLV
jgi:RsiW-degrading membrane proteinase PrsW (M82 family)